MPIELASVSKKVSLINISGEISSEKSIDASAIDYEINVIGSSQEVCFILINSGKNKFVFKIIVKEVTAGFSYTIR